MLECQPVRLELVSIFMRLQTGVALRQGQCVARGESDCCLTVPLMCARSEVLRCLFLQSDV